MRKLELVAHTNDVLGETPVWNHRSQTLWWADMETKRLHEVDPATGDVRSYALPEPLGSFGFRRTGGMICAFSVGLALFDPRTGSVDWLARPDPGNLFNDGKCDPFGNFWAGTMAEPPERRTGKLFRVAPDGTVTLMKSGLGIPNGLAWSADGTVFYLGDSADHSITRYDFRPMDRMLGPGTPFVQLDLGEATVDGAAVDAENCLWSAEWLGGRLVRYGPDGAVKEVLTLPVRVPTSCAFGGADMRTLFITTSRYHLAEPGLRDGSPDGGLFSVRVDVPGLKVHTFAG